MSKQNGRHLMPKKDKIYEYWVDILREDGHPLYEDACFACWSSKYIERAHIVPRNKGGADDASNLHLLCGACHRKTEGLEKELYFNWLKKERSLGVNYHLEKRLEMYGLDLKQLLGVAENDHWGAMLQVYKVLYGQEEGEIRCKKMQCEARNWNTRNWNIGGSYGRETYSMS